MADQVKNKPAAGKSSAKQQNKSKKGNKPAADNGKAAAQNGKAAAQNGKAADAGKPAADAAKPASGKKSDAKQASGKKSDAKQASGKKSDAKQAKASKASKQSKPANKKPNIFQRFVTYLKNVRLEIKRTTWPSRNELWRMSLIVVGALLFFGITIYGLDTLMTYLLSLYASAIPAPTDPATAEPGQIMRLIDQVVNSIY